MMYSLPKFLSQTRSLLPKTHISKKLENHVGGKDSEHLDYIPKANTWIMFPNESVGAQGMSTLSCTAL